METTAVDFASVAAAAARIDNAAESVRAAVSGRLGGLRFDAGTAGRSHGAAGAAVRDEVQRLTADLIRWAHAAGAVAGALRAGADGHTAAESAAAAALR